MKLINLSINGLSLFKDGFEIDFIARQKVTENNQLGLSHLVGNIYKHNVLGIIGINASGKTTTLRWISFALHLYLQEGKISDENYRTLLTDSEIEIKAYFTDSEFLYKIKSNIKKVEEHYIFNEEILWKKPFIKSLNRNTLFYFDEKHVQYIRSEQESLFLSDHMSIMISQIKNKMERPTVLDLLSDTNFNIMRVLGDIPSPIIQFLDNSIEYVKSEIDTNEYIRLKFNNQDDEKIIHSPSELFNYLSSGTVRGLNVFAAIRKALQSGGVLLIDEIENHFNHAIVKTIVELFKHPKTNRNGATLLFTTHYAELLDDFDRADSIYITFKEDTLKLKNFNQFSIRSEYKKSDIYDSSYLGKTAPSYEDYIDLKKYYINIAENISNVEVKKYG